MKTAITICVLILALKSFAQAPKENIEAIRKLGFLEGIWKGKGWIQGEEKKQYFNETETVSFKAGKTLLQIDVYGTSVDNDSMIINMASPLSIITWGQKNMT